MAIVERFDTNFQSTSRKRLWTAFKTATRSRHVQRFRDSLNETKATLTLAMVHERCEERGRTSETRLTFHSFLQARASVNLTKLGALRDLYQRHARKQAKYALPGTETSAWTRGHVNPFRSTNHFGDTLITDKLIRFEKFVSEQSTAKFQVQELMLNAIAKTAVAAFNPTSMEIFAQDGYTLNECGQLQSRTFVYAEKARYRVCHHSSSFRTALGCAWVRTTTLYLDGVPENAEEKSQTVTSLVFYPTAWLKFLGIRNGLDAVVAYASQSWLLNCRLTVTCSVPENSLIFDLCRTGQTRAVEMLLDKNMASVVDTSPDGWKPLHVRTPTLDSMRVAILRRISLRQLQDMSTYALCSSKRGQTSPP
jgi:hypothetical protein